MTLLNAAAFVAVMTFFKIAEEQAVGMYHHKSVAQSISENRRYVERHSLFDPHFLCYAIPFCAFAELGIVLGEGELVQLFFS